VYLLVIPFPEDNVDQTGYRRQQQTDQKDLQSFVFPVDAEKRQNKRNDQVHYDNYPHHC